MVEDIKMDSILELSKRALHPDIHVHVKRGKKEEFNDLI
jgi:hypothetical protein